VNKREIPRKYWFIFDNRFKEAQNQPTAVTNVQTYSTQSKELKQKIGTGLYIRSPESVTLCSKRTLAECFVTTYVQGAQLEDYLERYSRNVSYVGGIRDRDIKRTRGQRAVYVNAMDFIAWISAAGCGL